MTKVEFETIIGRKALDDEYEYVNYVYENHPAITDKHQVCDIYKIGGLRVIVDMCQTANLAKAIKDEIKDYECKIAGLKERYETLKNGSYFLL